MRAADKGGAAASSAGLCASCRHVEIVTSARGSTFYLCGLSYTDARFPKYPALPVQACGGFERTPVPTHFPETE
jgi:hypothetical protein